MDSKDYGSAKWFSYGLQRFFEIWSIWPHASLFSVNADYYSNQFWIAGWGRVAGFSLQITMNDHWGVIGSSEGSIVRTKRNRLRTAAVLTAILAFCIFLLARVNLRWHGDSISIRLYKSSGHYCYVEFGKQGFTYRGWGTSIGVDR